MRSSTIIFNLGWWAPLHLHLLAEDSSRVWELQAMHVKFCSLWNRRECVQSCNI